MSLLEYIKAHSGRPVAYDRHLETFVDEVCNNLRNHNIQPTKDLYKFVSFGSRSLVDLVVLDSFDEYYFFKVKPEPVTGPPSNYIYGMRNNLLNAYAFVKAGFDTRPNLRAAVRKAKRPGFELLTIEKPEEISVISSPQDLKSLPDVM